MANQLGHAALLLIHGQLSVDEVRRRCPHVTIREERGVLGRAYKVIERGVSCPKNIVVEDYLRQKARLHFKGVLEISQKEGSHG